MADAVSPTQKVYKVTHPDMGHGFYIFRTVGDLADCELYNGEVGDKIAVEIIEMTDEELKNLPEVELLEIARKCGLKENGVPPDLWVDPRVLKAMQAAYEAGERKERERCAKVAKKMQEKAGDVLAKGHDDDAAAQHDTAMLIAEAIQDGSAWCDRCNNSVVLPNELCDECKGGSQ